MDEAFLQVWASVFGSLLVPLALAGLAALFCVVFALYYLGWLSRNKPKPIEAKVLGQVARVTAPIHGQTPGKVVVYGEVWNAVSEADDAFLPDDLVVAVAFDQTRPRLLHVTRWHDANGCTGATASSSGASLGKEDKP